MNCDSCRSDIGVRRIENNIMLCAYCRYDPKKYEDDVAVKRVKKKKSLLQVVRLARKLFIIKRNTQK